MCPPISKPTHVTNSTATLIDYIHIYNNVNLLEAGISLFQHF